MFAQPAKGVVLAEIYKSKDEPENARVELERIERMPDTADLRIALAQLYASLNQGQR